MAEYEVAAGEQNLDAPAAPYAPNHGGDGPELLELEIQRYIAVLETDPAAAMRQYGFTLFHSLPPLHQAALMEKIGMEPNQPNDFLAFAALAISRGDYKGAIGHLQKCLADDRACSDAVYNLALCHEKLGNKSLAIQQWNRFLEIAESSEDRSAVEAHLAELTA